MNQNHDRLSPGGRGHYAWVILAVSVLVTMAAIGLARFGYTMVLPSMKEGLALTEIQAGDLATGNLLAYLLLAAFGGYLASRFGARTVIPASLLVVAVSMFLTGRATSYAAALLMRILTGLGSGGANVPVMGMLSAWFVSRRRGFASGVAVGGSSLALVAAGWLVPWILARAGQNGWRSVWYVLAASVFLIALAAMLLLRNRPSEKKLLPYGGTAGESEKADEARPPPSIVRRWSLVYRSPMVWQLGVVYAAFGFSYIIYATFFARYLTWEIGLSQAAAGRIWSGIGAGSLASGLLWGAVSDRVGRKRALALIFLVQGASYLLFGFWKAPAGYILSSVLFALTAWSIPAVMAAAAGDVVGSRLAPAGLGFITLFFGIGQAAGPFAAGRIAQVWGSYTWAFALAGGAALLGMLLSLSLRPFGGEPQEA